MDHEFVPNKLVLLEVANAFLYGELRDQLVDMDWFFLSDAVGAVHGLYVVLRIPVDIVNDDSVCSCQVDAESPGACREQEYLVFVGGVELVSEFFPLVDVSASIEAAVTESSEGTVLLENIEHYSKLREDQDFVILFKQLFQKLIHHFQLPAVLECVFSELHLLLRPHPFKQVRM